ncbi:MAG: ribokinase [Fidelibacterota bacterium]|nr:MAG: ribokinase [Candidatus Neomarinimicrobiota bacterium]
MAAPRIVVVGSSNTDMVIKMDRLPGPGETLIGDEFIMAAGGKGANQAVAAARLGGKVTFIARVGRDIFGQQAIEGFAKEEICTDFIVQDEVSPSGVALIFVDQNGENSIGVASGANGRLSTKDVSAAQVEFEAMNVLLLQLETPIETVRYAASSARKMGVMVILNPAPARPLDDDLLRNVTVLTPNESEAGLLTGVSVTDGASAEEAAKKLKQRGVKNVIITLGAKGALVVNEEGAQLVPSKEVQAVDTTAAGDAFNGALAFALAKGEPMIEAVRFANLTGALSATRMGAQPSMPTLEELQEFAR